MMKHLNILVVDDSNTNLVLLDAVLSSRKYKVYTANGAKEAYKYLKENQIDLILLDILMPKVSGFDILEYLKNNSLYKDIPVIIISAINSHETITKSIQLGAEAFLDKPVDVERLIRKIDEVIQKT